MTQHRSILAFAGVLLLVAGCASSGGRKSAEDMPYPDRQSPEWIGAPHIEGGLAATECVDDTAPMSILKRKATSLARAALAEELRLSAESLIKTQQESAVSEGGATWSEESQTAIKQMSTETLRNSRIARADYATIRGKSQYCVMVVIDRTTADELRDDIFRTTGQQVDPDDRATLWQAFLRTGKELDLEKEMER